MTNLHKHTSPGRGTRSTIYFHSKILRLLVELMTGGILRQRNAEVYKRWETGLIFLPVEREVIIVCERQETGREREEEELVCV